MAPISLINFKSKLDCWIYAIDMAQECLFMHLLLNDKSVIHKLKLMPWGLEADWRASLSQNVPYTDWQLWGLLETP